VCRRPKTCCTNPRASCATSNTFAIRQQRVTHATASEARRQTRRRERPVDNRIASRAATESSAVFRKYHSEVHLPVAKGESNAIVPLKGLVGCGCWLWLVGCWLLAVGCWLLAVGCGCLQSIELAKRQTPNAKRQTPKRQFAIAKSPNSPNAKRQTTKTPMRQSPIAEWIILGTHVHLLGRLNDAPH